MERGKKCNVCEKGLRSQNKSGFCYACYIIIWKQKNYSSAKPKGYKSVTKGLTKKDIAKIEKLNKAESSKVYK